MAEVLSQAEIDALLAAVSSGDVATGPKDGQPAFHAASSAQGAEDATRHNWLAYDLSSQERLIRGRFAGVQGISERFSRLFRSGLVAMLKRAVTVNYTNFDCLKFSAFLKSVLLPASFNTVHMANLHAYMVFVFGPKLSYALLDAYYGGMERPFSKSAGRDEFTTIEKNMIRKICVLAVNSMQEAWRLNFPVQLEYLRAESNPSFVGAIHQTESVIVLTYEIEFSLLSGPLMVVIPIRPLDPIRQFMNVNVSEELMGESDTWREHWQREIQQIEVECRVELGNATRTLRQIKAWAPGDVLTLSQDAAQYLTATIAGLPRFEGVMGTCRGGMALRLSNRLKTERE